jgi:hypothetical protein
VPMYVRGTDSEDDRASQVGSTWAALQSGKHSLQQLCWFQTQKRDYSRLRSLDMLRSALWIWHPQSP